ncbi:MAG: transcriptional repressor [Candidatus Cloacimonetes bacterium]|nr:transcriptional repressor [Candidatus Cloacimonadota bacterium]
MEYREVFINYLQSRGLKLTRPREAILDAVFAIHSHFDAEELYQMMRNNKSNVSLATVYRTLPYLLQAGLIRKSMCDESKEHYEHIYGHPNHLHLLCVACGRIVEQTDEELERVLNRIAKHNGFSMQDNTVRIKGLCSLCRKKP